MLLDEEGEVQAGELSRLLNQNSSPAPKESSAVQDQMQLQILKLNQLTKKIVARMNRLIPKINLL